MQVSWGFPENLPVPKQGRISEYHMMKQYDTNNVDDREMHVCFICLKCRQRKLINLWEINFINVPPVAVQKLLIPFPPVSFA